MAAATCPDARPCGEAAVGFGPNGGVLTDLSFVVVGDSRPATIDDTAAYPTSIVERIFDDIQALRPAPRFGLCTGDYMFASPGGGQAAIQLDLYLRARTRYSGLVFFAMGNHECTGATASNCGAGNVDGVTDNYAQFLSKLARPLGRTKAYYWVPLVAHDSTWTAKVVIVAANAWDDVQASWLEQILSRPTTYTFFVRHEPASTKTAPGVGPSEAILSRYPYTLSIVGHSHTYARSGGREVIIGNGGAPLTSALANYGFALVRRRPDGAIQLDVLDYMTSQPDPTFTFAVKPDGSPAL